jgi:hypothetical protein
MQSARFEITAIKMYAAKLATMRKHECPISLTTLKDPVYHVVDGVKQVFSKESIKGWLLKRKTCPLTNTPLNFSDLLIYHDLDVLTKDMAPFYHNDGSFMSDEKLEENIQYVNHFLATRFFTDVANCDVETVRSIYGEHMREFVNTLMSERSPIDRVLNTRNDYADKMLDFLIQSGADVNLPTGNNDLPIHIAIRRNNINQVKALLLAGAKITLRSFIYAARINGCDDIFNLLQQQNHGLDLTKCYDREENLLHIFSAKFNSHEIIIQLIKLGINVNEVDHQGRTPLHNAVQVKNGKMNILTLLAFGADASLTDNEDNQPVTANIKCSYYREQFDNELRLLRLAGRDSSTMPVVVIPMILALQLDQYGLLESMPQNIFLVIELTSGYKISFKKDDQYNEKYIDASAPLAFKIKQCMNISPAELKYVMTENSVNPEQRTIENPQFLAACQNVRNAILEFSITHDRKLEDTVVVSAVVPKTESTASSSNKPVEYLNQDISGSHFTLQGLLALHSLVGVTSDKQTLGTNGFDADTIKTLKIKIVSDYILAIRQCDNFNDLLSIMSFLKSDDRHVLRLNRKGIFDYGDTDSYLNVMVVGQCKLIELANCANYSLITRQVGDIKLVFAKNYVGDKSYREKYLGRTTLNEFENDPFKLLYRDQPLLRNNIFAVASVANNNAVNVEPGLQNAKQPK